MTDSPDREGPSGVDPRLLELLICPVSREPLRYDQANNELISDKARIAYRIENGIPIMLADDARDLDA